MKVSNVIERNRKSEFNFADDGFYPLSCSLDELQQAIVLRKKKGLAAQCRYLSGVLTHRAMMQAGIVATPDNEGIDIPAAVSFAMMHGVNLLTCELANLRHVTRLSSKSEIEFLTGILDSREMLFFATNGDFT